MFFSGEASCAVFPSQHAFMLGFRLCKPDVVKLVLLCLIPCLV